MKLSDYHKNFLTLLSGNGLAQVIPFAIGPILSRLYTPEEFGSYSNFMAIMGLFVIVACGRMELAIMLPQLKEDALDVVRKALFYLKWILLISLGCGLFLSDTLSQLFESPDIKGYLFMLPIFVLINGIYLIAYNWLVRMSKYKMLASSNIVMAAVMAVVNVGMGFMGFGVAGLILANLIGMATLLVMFHKTIAELWKGVKARKGMPLTEVSTRYRDFPRVNMAHAFFDVANQQFLFNLIFTSLFGVMAMGFYALSARYVRAPIRSFNASIAQVYYSEASALVREGKAFSHLMLRSVRTMLVFAIPFLVVLLLFAPDLFSWFFGEEWHEAGLYARALSPAICSQFLVSPVSMTPIICSRQKSFFIWSVSIQVSALVLIWFLGSYLDWTVCNCLWAYSSLIVLYSFSMLAWFYKISSSITKTDQ
jgi:O-antigen/teichoic acid export membrane protein